VEKVNIFWFRRDLRLFDNAGLFAALSEGSPVLPVFIFDKDILDSLDDRSDKRLLFIHQEITHLKKSVEAAGGCMVVQYGKPIEVFQSLTEKYPIGTVFANRDYEPYAQARDQQIETFLRSKNIGFKTSKDQVIFEQAEIVKDDGSPYTVFTPFSRKWKAALAAQGIPQYPSENKLNQWFKANQQAMPSLESMGFQTSDVQFPGKAVQNALIKNYPETRNLPAINGTSQMSLHLRFGTVSVRQLAQQALENGETYLNELIWREFFQMILWHFPKVVTESFKPQYDQIAWQNDPTAFQLWCQGRTGYPLVDAGMRELNTTGFMHNRVRMVVASFLTKHLLIDWRWGEAYFAAKLLDYELASNNGNWQWAAGSGCDAAPYFRIFNPESQAKKFDPKEQYIKKWVPEIGSPDYPAPIVEHTFARERALHAYKQALTNNGFNT
jgi:deoxyribodipyrimidine photo-lyase